MKQWLFALSFIICGTAQSQIYSPTHPTIYGENFQRIKPMSVLHIPYGSDTTLRTTDTSAQIRLINGNLMYHWGGVWRQVAGGGVGGIDTGNYNLLYDQQFLASKGDTLTVNTKGLNNYNGIFNVRDYGAKGDGTTQDSVAVKAAITAASLQGGGTVYFPYGQYVLPPIIVKKGVKILGEGMSHSPLYVGGMRQGTTLLITGVAGKSDISYDYNTSFSQIENISVYNTNNAAIRAVVEIPSNLYPIMTNVEISSLAHTTGAGLLLTGSVEPYWATLYGLFNNVSVITNEVVGCAYGLEMLAVTATETPNANRFIGGHFQGYKKSLYMHALINGALMYGTSFLGTAFESYYNSQQDHEYITAPANIVAIKSYTSLYAFKWMDVNDAWLVIFEGCYFENGGTPSTYNDGTHGTKALMSVVSLASTTNKVDIKNATNLTQILDRGTGNNDNSKITFLNENNFSAIRDEVVGVTSQLAMGSGGYYGLRAKEDRVLVGSHSSASETSTSDKLQVYGNADFTSKIRNTGIIRSSPITTFLSFNHVDSSFEYNDIVHGIHSDSDILILNKNGGQFIIGDSVYNVSVKDAIIDGHSTMMFMVENVEVARVDWNYFIANERVKFKNVPVPDITGQDVLVWDRTDSVIKRIPSSFVDTVYKNNAGDSLVYTISGRRHAIEMVQVPSTRKDTTITTSTYTVAAGIKVVFSNYSGGTATITLPSASSNLDAEITIKNISSNNVTVTPISSNDANTLISYGASTFKSDGTTWFAISKY